jgi:hypothetical protein
MNGVTFHCGDSGETVGDFTWHFWWTEWHYTAEIQAKLWVTLRDISDGRSGTGVFVLTSSHFSVQSSVQHCSVLICHFKGKCVMALSSHWAVHSWVNRISYLNRMNINTGAVKRVNFAVSKHVPYFMLWYKWIFTSPRCGEHKLSYFYFIKTILHVFYSYSSGKKRERRRLLEFKERNLPRPGRWWWNYTMLWLIVVWIAVGGSRI